MKLQDELEVLSDPITNADDLEAGFNKLFRSEQAKQSKNGVYFLLSLKEIPRVKGKSKILYIGSTTQSMFARYGHSAKSLSRSVNGIFYRWIINEYDGIQWGFVRVEEPKVSEQEYFKRYCEEHCEYPPKSKVG